MAAKDKKITLKGLHSEIVTLKEELNFNKKCLEEVQKELNDAKDKIKELRYFKNIKEKDSFFKCNSCNFSCGSRKSLKFHITENHVHKIKCKTCDDIFDKNSELEAHIKSYHNSIEKFECDQCAKSFVLKWRLEKHQEIHKDKNIKRCHYFNNQKDCPFEEIGCMFQHTYSGICRYGEKCKKIMCSFQHSIDESFECDECGLTFKTETELGKHIDEKHEGWRVTQNFCDYFCRVEHDVHICWSSEDFHNYIGFDIWKTRTTMESESVFKCLRCDKTDDDSDRMREHIAQKHTLDKASKCNFCEHEDKTWLGLKKHYKLNHMNKH